MTLPLYQPTLLTYSTNMYTQTSVPSRTTLPRGRGYMTVRTTPTTMYAALIGPRCVDVYSSYEAAIADITRFAMGWVLELHADAILEDALQGTAYDGVPLFYAPW